MPASPSESQRPLRLEYVEAGSLTPNPANWRLHPPEQLAALQSVLADPEVGWANALLFNERTGRLIDGHGRLKTVKPTDVVPVLIGSWSADAERQILLSHDAITQLALPDVDQLRQLLDDTPLGDDLLSFADGLRASIDATLTEDEDAADAATAKPPVHRLSIRCSSEEQQQDLLERLTDDGVPCRALVG